MQRNPCITNALPQASGTYCVVKKVLIRHTPMHTSGCALAPPAFSTSDVFFFIRGWDKLVAVLFHGTWTQESQHAVSLLESLAHQRHQPAQSQQQPERQEQKRHSSESSGPAADKPPASPDQGRSSATAQTERSGAADAVQRASGGFQVLLAEANVMSLIDVRGGCRYVLPQQFRELARLYVFVSLL